MSNRDKTRTHRTGWNSALLGTALLGLAAGAGIYGFRGCSSADAGDRAKAALDARNTAELEHIEIPKFGRPEEAKRYFDAMIDGDRRSLELLDQALRDARSGGKADQNYIAELERERRLRSARVKAYVAARVDQSALR